MDTTLTEWKVEDYVKTPEDRAMFLEASLEEAVTENDPGIFSDALVEIVRSMGRKKNEKRVAAVLQTVSASIDMMQAMLGNPNAATRMARRTPARREPARA